MATRQERRRNMEQKSNTVPCSADAQVQRMPLRAIEITPLSSTYKKSERLVEVKSWGECSSYRSRGYFRG